MTISLARHCESEYNVKGLLNGDPSIKVSLTKKGTEQAKSLAQSLNNTDFDVIYASELLRTQQTAHYINVYYNKDIVIDKRLNDNISGFEGRKIEEYINAIDATPDGYRAKFNDGESLEEVFARVKNFVDELKHQNIQSCVIITSGYIIECLYGIISDTYPSLPISFDIPQGTYSAFTI